MRAEIEGSELVIYGDPPDLPEGHPDYHNCDAMGCPSLAHVLAVLPLPRGLIVTADRNSATPNRESAP